MPKTVDSPAMKFITRTIFNSWRVLITFGELDFGQVYFNDSEHGGKRASLKAAKAYRDEVVREHAIPMRKYDGNGYFMFHSRNKSGTVGVFLACTGSHENPRYVAWSVRNMQDGKQKTAAFSVRKYGYEGAWREAIAIRAKHTGLPPPDAPPPPPAWLRAWALQAGVPLPARAPKKKRGG